MTPATRTSTIRRRIALAAGAVAVAAIDLSAKAWAENYLDAPIPLGPIDLRLAYNPGVAFSMGTGAPTWLIIAVTATITVVVAAVAWRAAAAPARLRLTALTLVLGGAAANLIDRARDGVVTDYLHSGWFPTFNLADTTIVTGAGLLVLAAARHRAPDTDVAPGPAPGAFETEPT
ncbi:signal peptidase II [Actinotalea sp. K2]|uniref:signal peptidase II n=1 Tax=Actinotalea sp. K2 TaxID=2939438 RepID=UPI0020177E75|nr:signal peptidase II [Actinotalea sp. K2]MCL3862993.1 signal peptidase II [Actinotalea sp. K2]